jgi:hypothetical protein
LSQQPQTTTDKNIVDRSRAHKNAALVKTVRVTREQLAARPRALLPGFDREMVRFCTSTLCCKVRPHAPVLVILAAVGGLWFDEAVWLLGMGALHHDRMVLCWCFWRPPCIACAMRRCNSQPLAHTFPC